MRCAQRPASRLLLCLAVIATCVGSIRTSAAEEPPATAKLTADEKAFFAWWDKLGYPDITTLPFVKLWRNGRPHSAAASDDAEWPEGAFLIREDGPRIVVFHTDLSIEHIESAPPDPKRERVRGQRYARADLAQYVKDGLERIEKVGPEVPWFSKPDPFGAHRWSIPNQAFRIAVLARACAARGHSELAHRLIDRARHEQTRPALTQQYGDDDPRPRSRLSSIKASIESEAAYVVMRSYSDASLSWTDLLREEERLARAFNPAQLTATDGRIAQLRAIVEEERHAREHPPKPLEELSQEERIERLIHDLRNVGAYYRDGRHRAKGNKKSPSAAGQLIAIGFAAVPALLDALDDERPTRSVDTMFSFKGQFRDSTVPLVVGDLAWNILDWLSGRTLGKSKYGGPPTSGQPTKRQAAERWYASVLERGEKAVLIDEIRRGGSGARSAADRLVGLDAEAAVAALEVGIRAADDQRSVRMNLVYKLVAIQSPAATEALLRLLPSLHDSSPRITVASSLFRRGKKEGLDDLVRTWNGKSPAGANSDSHDRLLRGFADDRADLIRALAATNELAAVSALANGLSSRLIDDRIEVIRAFSPSRGGRFHAASGPGYRSPASEATEAAIEALLAGRLEDTERRRRMSFGDRRAGIDPVVAELAAWVLAERYPKRYSFDPDAPPRERAAQRVAVANQWRAAHGMPPIELPAKRPAPTPIPADALRDDLARAASGATDTARAPAIVALEAQGLAAVPAIRQALASLAEDAPGRGDLEALVRRLAFVVADVRITGDKKLAGDDFRSALGAAKGKPITGAMWWRLYAKFATSAPRGATTRLALSVERDGAARGVLLRASLTSTKASVSTQDVGDASFEHPRIRCDDNVTGSGSGGMPISVFARPGMFAEYEGKLDEQLASTEPDAVVTIEGEVTVHR